MLPSNLNTKNQKVYGTYLFAKVTCHVTSATAFNKKNKKIFLKFFDLNYSSD